MQQKQALLRWLSVGFILTEKKNMNEFASYNPIAVFIYYISFAAVSMFCADPIFTVLSLAGAVAFYVVRNGGGERREHLFALLLFTVSALLNPLLSHKGETVLFVMNNNPITLEALTYGIFTGGMIASVIYIFRSFSQIMTSDRLLYLLGTLSPKLSLLLSMTLRFIPLYKAQSEKINEAQTAMGLYKEDNIIDSIRGRLRIFSVMVTWALENGIITADSMTARGYGVGRRTYFSLYRFTKRDAISVSVTLILTSLILSGVYTGDVGFEFYPRITLPAVSPISVCSYISFGILAFMPTAIEIYGDLKWKYLQSRL